MAGTIDKLALLISKLKSNMAVFGKICFGSAYKKDTPVFHDDIYKALINKAIKKVLIAAPRGTAKSTIVSLILPMFLVAFKDPKEDEFIVIISESRPQSINFLSRIKSHLEARGVFRLLFGNFSSDTAKRWREDDIILKNGVRIIAIGTGSRIRGFIERDTRPTTIIMDDIESETNAATKEARAKNRKWVTEAVIPSLADNGRIIMIGTVISEDCFLYWAKESPVWHVLWFSIIDDSGQSIWPEKYPLSRIQEIKDSMASVGNLNGFFQEYMNQAQSPEEAPFQAEYVKLHHYILERDAAGEPYLTTAKTGLEDENRIKIPIDIYQGVDPASSLSAKADFFVIATVGIANDNKRYLLDIFRDKIPPSKQPQKIIDKYLEFKPIRVKVETVAYQEALRDGTRALMRKKKIYIPGLESGVKPRSSKSERLLSLVPLLASGDFYFKPEHLEAQREFLSYPRGKYDDIMDAIWTAMQNTYPCRRKKVVTDEDIQNKVTSRAVYSWKIL